MDPRQPLDLFPNGKQHRFQDGYTYTSVLLSLPVLGCFLVSKELGTAYWWPPTFVPLNFLPSAARKQFYWKTN